MEEQTQRVVKVDVGDEMKKSFIDYAMSVIVERALPDVRDGLKPVHRRILYAMSELGIGPQSAHKKSARIVGEVMGKFHPHGDSAIYDTMVRLAQDFSIRYKLVDGSGNFGSVDGDPPAAMRYTEARLSPLALEMLRDIEKETVDFVPNFDETLTQPTVLPCRFPNLLVNGSSGIAVGMATNIPPHNLSEVIDALVMMIDDPDVTTTELMDVIKGPDFPTGGTILGREGIRQAYRNGRGRIRVRAKSHIEEMKNGKSRIIVNEIPYLVNKASLIEKIADLVHTKRIDGITDLRDESDRSGMRIMIELRRDVNPQVILNQLYKHTQLEESFGANMLALVDGEPKVLSLQQFLSHYLDHQKDVVIRRTKHDLEKAEARAHILEGLRIALDHIDEIIKLIRGAQSEAQARSGLMERFGLSERQANAILEMQLRRLTGLERDKIESEYQEVLSRIARYREILANEHLVMEIIKEELTRVKERYGDERRTDIQHDQDEIETEDLIPKEEIAVTLTHQGYIKRLPVTTYKAQRRGGRGVTGMNVKEEDFVEHIAVTGSHNYLLFFTSGGKVFRLKGYQIPEAGRNAKGTAIVNLLQTERDEKITAIIPVKRFAEDQYLMMATKNGIVKRTPLGEFETIRANGLIAINLDEGDCLVGVKRTHGQDEALLVTAFGQAIRFIESDVRSMGRTARGVKGIDLEDGDRVVGFDIMIDRQLDLLVITEHGYGKRTPLEEYRLQTRGGKGLKTLRVTEKNGALAGVRVVRPDDEIIIITSEGVVIRMEVEGISTMSRVTQGVRLMRLDEDDRVVAMARIKNKE